jgi:hypothetical protein
MNRTIIVALLVGIAIGIASMTLMTTIPVHAQPPVDHEAYSISAGDSGAFVLSTKGSVVYCGTTKGSCVTVRGNEY